MYFQIGHIRELTQDFNAAKDAYERVLMENSKHAKALQQLGWYDAFLYHNSHRHDSFVHGVNAKAFSGD
eukprot:SAG31_NODE_7206_length_1755_cov_1.945048_2_plen_69_part_00